MANTTPSGNKPLTLEDFKGIQEFINVVNMDKFPSIDSMADDFPPALLEAWQNFYLAKQSLNARLAQYGVDTI